MAKGYGLTGKVRGKIGAQVYRIVNGEQVISEFNPTKADPKTGKQLMARAKMALANEISSALPFEAIVGYNYRPAAARRGLIGSLLLNASVTEVGTDDYKATIAYDSIQLSRGVQVAVDSTRIRLQNLTTTVVDGSINITKGSGIVRFLLVVLPFNPETGHFVRAHYAISPDFGDAVTQGVQVEVNSERYLRGYELACYIVPIVANSLEKRARYGRILELTGDNEFTTSVAIEYARAGLFAGSIPAEILTLD